MLEARLVLATVDVLNYRYDLATNGVNAAETALSPVNVKVGSFGKLYETPLDGNVYAQPLIVNGATIASGVNTVLGAAGTHDVIYTATEHDSLYAIDAHTGAILWKRSFLDTNDTGGNISNPLGASSISTLVTGDVISTDLTEVGITSTPVIDKAAGIIYVEAKTKEVVNGVKTYVQRLHAIKLSTGTDAVSPYQFGTTTGKNTNTTDIYVYGTGDGNVPDTYNGTANTVVQFNALREHQRSALSLVNGKVYIEWASHGDNGPYHGWVVMLDVANLATKGFKLAGALNLSPNGSGAGIWESGNGLTFDASGAAYLETGNGFGSKSNPVLDANGFPVNGNYYEAAVKVVSDPSTSPTNQNINGWGLKVADYFIPHNILALDNVDQDLGSGGPLPLPDSAGIPGHPHLLAVAGKQGVVYIIDRDNMGKFNPDIDQVVSSNSVVGAVLSTPSYYNNLLYYSGGYSSILRSVKINSNGKLSNVSQSDPNVKLGYLPGSVAISANGNTGGIVWSLDRNANLLHAYDATAMTTELWNSGQAANQADALGASVKFGTPMVADGQVFVGTASNTLVSYGLKPPPNSVPNAPSNLAATALSPTSVNLTWFDNSIAPNAATGFIVQSSTDGTNFSQLTTVTGGATSISIGGLQPSTTYKFRILAYNGPGNSAPSNVATVTTGAGAPQAPAAPSGLGAVPTTATSITLNWTNNATNQTGFTFDRATDSGFTQNLVTVKLPASPLSYTDTAQGLFPGSNYYYRIRATNAAGTSANSNVAIVSIPVAPPRPSDTHVTNVTTNRLDLIWTDNAGTDATSYVIQRRVGTGGDFSVYAVLPAANETPPSEYTWSDTNLTPGTAYSYHILAFNSSGNNDFSGTNAVTLTLPPSGLTASPGTNQIALSWNETTGALNYNIYRGTTPGGETLLSGGVTATSYVDSNIAPGTKYYYKVRAVNQNSLFTPPLPSESAGSNEVSASQGSPTTPSINFPNGFATGTAGLLTFNGGAAVSGSQLILTDGKNDEARSVFTTSPVNISKFTTSFTFQIAAGASIADGFAFVIQGISNTALGSKGGGLGYANDGITTGAKIDKSMAIKFDVYNNAGEGLNSTGLYTNGANPTATGSVPLPSSIDLHSGHAMVVMLSYDGSNLVETITDSVTKASFSRTYTGLNLSGLVGGQSAYVGFTAGTGGTSAKQAIQNWTYSPLANQVDLSAAYNLNGIQTDGVKFTNGINGAAISANQLGTSQTWNGQTFTFGAPGTKNVIQALGQTVALTVGNFSQLSFLATATAGSVNPRTFTITYTDGTTQSFSQGISDWHTPQNYAGESKVVSMAYKNLANGTNTNLSSGNSPYYVYGYSVVLNSAKTVKSITLPNQAGIDILAIDLS